MLSNNIEMVIDKILRKGDSQAIALLITSFGDKHDGYGRVSALLTNDKITLRFFGLLKHMILTAPNSQASQAYQLGLPLLRWLYRNQSLIEWNEQVKFEQYAASVLFNYCMACYNTAEFDSLNDVFEEFDHTSSELLNEQSYWSSRAYLAMGAIRQLDIVRAEALLNVIPSQYEDIEQYDKALQEVNAFKAKRFEVAQPKLSEDKILEIWQTTIPQMKATLANCQEKGGDSQILQSLFTILTKMERAIEGSASLSEKIKAVALLRKLYSDLSRKLIFDQQGAQITLQTLDIASEYTEILLDTANLNKLKQHQVYLESLLQWTDEKRDHKGSLLMLWCLTLIDLAIAKQTQDTNVAIKRLTDLLGLLKELKNKPIPTEYKAGLVNYHPGIISKVFDFNGQVLDQSLAIEVSEFLKGRSLIAIESDNLNAQVIQNTAQAMLGECTHYLSFICDHYLDKVYCTFYCASGKRVVETLPIKPSTIRGYHYLLNPKSWSRKVSFFSKDITPQTALSPLLMVVERLLKNSDIKKGDHICIAADDPISLLPFSYLTIAEQLFVYYFSYSFVASFSDALAIYRSPLQATPNSACGVFVSRADEKHRDEKFNRFNGLSNLLTSHINQLKFIDYSGLPLDLLFTDIQHQSIVHFDSHGYFQPNCNPYYDAGLLISNGKSAPTGKVTNCFLLTPEKLLGSGINLDKSHITLNACVSGLGHSGYGGDILGLEFAFRYLGADSVIASHWEVEGTQTDVFLREFYQLWLEEKLPRSSAWRQATLNTIIENQTQSLTEAAQYCFFSLYGDWR